MIRPEERRMMDTQVHAARTAESDTVAEVALNILTGMIWYASARDITPAEHSAEMDIVRLIRAERAALRSAA